MFWKTADQFQTCHFCLKSSNKSVYTNPLHICKKTTSAILSNQPTSPDTAPRPPFTNFDVLLTAIDEEKISVLLLLDLLATFDTTDHRFFFPVSKLSLACTQLHSSGFDNNRWTEFTPLLSTVLLPLLLLWCLEFLRAECWALYTTPLSDILASQSVNYQLFAHDTQHQKSTAPNDVRSLTRDLQLCTYDKNHDCAAISSY